MNRSTRTQTVSEPYASNTTIADIADALRQASTVLITTHAKPDGDALGSVLALAAALERAGKSVQRWVIPPVLGSLQSMIEDGVDVHLLDEDDPAAGPTDAFDRIVVVDTGAWSQLAAFRPWLEPQRERIIVIDHHRHGDDISALRYVDAEAPAACQIVAEVIDALGVTIDETIAESLYIGIATDTGWFRFSNTTPATHELAARLMRCGVDHAGLYAQLEQCERPEKLLLLIRALGNMQLIADGRAALMTLSAADFQLTGARPEETERLVDIPQIVEQVQVVVLITETDTGARLSLRSKPGPGAIDVNQLAQQFGGGGHDRAAGAKIDRPLDHVRRDLIEAIEALW